MIVRKTFNDDYVAQNAIAFEPVYNFCRFAAGLKFIYE